MIYLFWFIYTISDALDASLLRNMLAGKCVIRAGGGIIQTGKGTITTRQDFQCRLILWLIFKDLMLFIQVIVFPMASLRMGHI